jgi:DNA-binding response OmpR family regulator
MTDTPMRILLVEDNPADARLLQILLKEAGSAPLEMRHADRLSTGLKYVAEPGIDVVLLDLSLPDSQGVETLVRMHEAAGGVPIVVMTGIEDEALGVALVQAGAQDYLVKGQVTGALLTRSLRYAAERKRAEEKLRSK